MISRNAIRSTRPGSRDYGCCAHHVSNILLAAILLSAPISGCRRTSFPPAPAIRLVELFTPSAVTGQATEPAAKPPRTEWRFDGPASPSPNDESSETLGWRAGHGIAELTLNDGRLVGRSTDEFPLLHVERTSGLTPDSLHAVEVRMRASAGSNLSIIFRESETVDFDDVIDKIKNSPFGPMTTPIVPGDELRTYTLRTPFSVVSSSLRHIIIRPTDAADANFEIESVRIIFRRDYLAGIPSGLGWQGLSEVYRETLVARSPEVIRLTVKLPARPWLDLAVGTVENGPVTFKVSVQPTGVARTNGSDSVLLQRTVTTPHRWESTLVDLADFAGQEVSLSLSLSAGASGALGFWGSPVVRSQGAPPIRTAAAMNSTDGPQGVILIWADTLRADHLSAYGFGRKTTPILDDMASQGTLFKDCLVQATWTKVSTPSLMTSLYPTSHGVLDFSDRLPASADTLAEIFRDAGYATLSLSSILFTGKFTNLHQGFEVVHESASLSDRASSKTSREYVDRLLPWLETHRNVPFFVFLHVSDPHDPFLPYPPYDGIWADRSKKDQHEHQAEAVREFIADPVLKQFGMPNRDELAAAGLDPDQYVAHEQDWYDGSILAMDVEIGRIFEHLRNLNLDEKTMVIFTSDHGEEFLEHGRMFHGQSVYGELNQIPLIIRRPGAIPQGLVVNETVQNIDLMPTLLELCGLPIPTQLQGRSLAPLLDREAASGDWQSRPAITEKAATQSALGPPPRDTESYAIVSDGWKLIRNTIRPDHRPEFELYDHRNDRLNQTNLAAEHPDIVKQLTEKLAAWQAAAKAARLKSDSDAATELTADQLERLRALGYIQ